MIHVALTSQDLADLRAGQCLDATGYAADGTREDIQVHAAGCAHTS